MSGTPAPSSPRGRRPLALLSLALPLALFLHQGLVGLDFGRHWDERQMTLLVRESVEAGRLRPRWYHYPALPFLIARAALATTPLPPRVLAEQGRTAALVETTRSRRYRLRTRAFFLAVSSVAVPAAGLLALALGLGPFVSLLASLFAAGSFELAYHARWFAPDGPLAAFALLALAAAAAAFRTPSGRARAILLLSSVLAAAIAASAKITGALFLAAPLAVLCLERGRRGRALLSAAAGLTLFAAVFVAITPGVLTDTARFLEDLRFEMRHYGEKGHYGFTIEPGLPYLARLGLWLGTEALSPFRPLALLSAALAALGLFGLLRSRAHRRAALVVLLPASLLLALLASQRVLFVRNALVFVPLLAVLAAAGGGALLSRLSDRRRRALLAALLLSAPVLHGIWLEREAYRIRADTDRTLALRQFADWLSARPDGPRVGVPDALAEALSAHLDEKGRARLVAADSDEWEFFAFRCVDHPRPGRMPSNVPHLLERWFGRRQVNLPWYTTWLGHHVILVAREHVAAWHVLDEP